MPEPRLKQSVAIGIPIVLVQLAVLTGWTQVGIAQAPPPRPPAGIPLGSPLPGIVPPRQLKVAPGLPAPAPLVTPAPSQAGQSFPIRTVSVDGMTAFTASDVDPITAGMTGPVTTEGQIETARRAIVDLYRGNGYVYTTVRAMIHAGELQFSVVEGYIAEVQLDGDVGPAGTQVLRFLNNLIGQKPLEAKTMERWLLLASDIPGLTVRSTLNPSTGDPGALTLIARVARKSISGYVSADNRAAPFAGPTEGIAIVSFDSFTEYGERTQLSFYGAPGPNLFGQASEEFFLGGSGLKMKLYGGAGPGYPTGQLQAIGYNTFTTLFGGQLSYPIIRVREQTLNATIAFDAIETNTDTNLGPGGSSLRGSYDSLRIIRLGGDYALFDTLFGSERSATNGASILLSQGLVALGSGRNGDVTTPPARLGEKVDFTKFSGSLSRTQTLFEPFDDASVALRGTMNWQATGDLLPPVEKYYLGGPHFNRGYYYGQVSGDQAVAMSAELQLNTPLPLPPKWPLSLQAQFYTFYDWGQAWQNTKLEANAVLQSLGGGVRLFVNDNTEIDFEGVYRGNVYPNGSGPGISALPSEAFYWQVSFRF